MSDDPSDVETDEDTYEVKAIKAYLAGELKAKDLQVSLGVSRPVMFRRITRSGNSARLGSIPKKSAIRIEPIQPNIATM
jgi:hypothetical protein